MCVGGDGGTDGRVEGGQMDGSVGGRREGRRGGWMDRGRDERTDGWVGGQLDGRKEGRTDSRMGGWRDRQMSRCAEERPPCLLPRPSLSPLPMGHRAPVPTGRAGADPGQCPIPADTAPTLPRRGDGAAVGGGGGWESGQCQATPWPSVRPRPAGPQLQWLVLVEPHHVPRECPGTVKTPVLMVLSARPWQGELLRSTLQPPPAGAQGKLRHGGAGSTPGMDCGLQHGHPACGNSPRGKESAWGHGDRVFTRGMGGGPAPAWV